ncbi:hypothetical protein [Pikeienuella sp. HZG-20]|uniref:hypothetical protein n=1 Tax=Paludibacillus litoralis TaxID=3133267 RepID=UPI0030EE9E08
MSMPEKWRAMIDAHIAEKGVTRVPLGVVAIDLSMSLPSPKSDEKRDSHNRMYYRQRRFEKLALREERERDEEEAARLARLGAEAAAGFRAPKAAPRKTVSIPALSAGKAREDLERSGVAVDEISGASISAEHAEMRARITCSPEPADAVRPAMQAPVERAPASVRAGIASRRGDAGLAEVLKICAAAKLTPARADVLRAVEVLLFEPEFERVFRRGAIAHALRDLPAARRAAHGLRRASGEPLYRALAVSLYRRAAS